MNWRDFCKGFCKKLWKKKYTWNNKHLVVELFVLSYYKNSLADIHKILFKANTPAKYTENINIRCEKHEPVQIDNWIIFFSGKYSGSILLIKDSKTKLFASLVQSGQSGTLKKI